MGHLQWNDFLERLDDNRDLARELAKDFLSSVEERWNAYDLASRSSQPKRIEQAAHALRGLLAPYGGEAGMRILKRVEEAARLGLIDCETERQSLRSILDQMKYEIRAELNRFSGEVLS